MLIRSIPMVVLALALAATASDADARGRKFSCPMEDKRACMSTEEVYEETGFGQDLEVMAEGKKGRSKRQQEDRRADEPVMAPRPVESVGGAPVPTPSRCCDPVRTSVTVKGDTLAVASPNTPPSAVTYSAPARQSSQAEMVVRTTREEPFRVPAKVIRIYISPWEDEQGDLHMGGYVFSEIEPRKWTVGTRAVSAEEGYRLLTLNSPVRDAAQDAKSGQGDATAPANRTE